MKVRMQHIETGEFAVGVLETVYCSALAAEFEVNDTDGLAPVYEGETEVFWNSQEPDTDPMTGEVFLVTEAGDSYPESEFERVPVDAT